MNSLNVREYISQKFNYPILHQFSHANIGHFDRLHIEYGEDIYLFDDYGNRYIDVTSGLWNVSLGYNNKTIQNSMIGQINRLSYCSLFEHTNNVVIKSANKLLDLTDNIMKKVIFACSGSETNEIAIKLIRKVNHILGYANKNLILSFEQSYHGTYYGSISISGLEQDLINEYKPLLPQIKFINPECSGNKGEDGCINCIAKLEKMIAHNAANIGGIFIEPILASKGMLIICQKYIHNLVEICRRNNILVVFDEVATGFYRTGTCFYYNKIDIKPDILCLSKGINAGYLPIGAVLINDIVLDALQNENGVFEHGSTQAGNVIACASILAAQQEYEKLISNDDINKKSKWFYDNLLNKLQGFNCIRDIRHEGFMFSIDIQKKSHRADINQNVMIVEELKNNHILVQPSELGISLLPMLITTIEQWEHITDEIKSVFNKLDF